MSTAKLLINTDYEDDIPAEPEGDIEHPQDAMGDEPKSPRDILANLIKQVGDINIARNVDAQVLQNLGQMVTQEYEIDANSRSEWREQIDKAMDMATQNAQEKQFPWPKASNVIFPIISSAALQFQARTYPAIIQNRNVVKGVVWGDDKGTPATEDGSTSGKPMIDPASGGPVWIAAPGEKRQRADRIGQHMSYQLLEEMTDWEPQTDILLGRIPIVGGEVRKTFYDPVTKQSNSLTVPIVDLVWNYHAPSFEGAPRHTEIVRLYPTDIETLERSEMVLPLEYGPGSDISDSTAGGGTDPNPTPASDPDAPHTFLEQHRRFDLDGDGYAEPLVVTVHQQSSRVVRITARYDQDGIVTDDEERIVKIIPDDHYTLYPFLPNPKSGSHPLGWGHLAKPLNESINTALNQMFDAGTLQNTGGGFIGTSLSLHSGPVNFQVGRYVPVNNKGQNIRDSVYTIPFPGPSQVLFNLLELLLGAAKEITGTQDILAGDASVANAPPTTVLALIEQGSKLYTSIHKRVYRAMKAELQKLYKLNRRYLAETARYRVGDEWLEVTPDDYRLGGGVEPIADPTMVTDAQRLGRATVLMTLANDPHCNPMEIRRRYLEYAGIERVDEILVPPDPAIGQMAMAKEMAELGRLRAAEQKDATQAFLNLAEARAKAAAPEIEWINNQLEVLRLSIEANNTIVKAADVEHKSRKSMQNVKESASNVASTARAGLPATAAAPVGPVGAGI